MSAAIEELDCQEKSIYTGADADITVTVLAADYPNPSTFNWRLQIFDPDDDTVCLVQKTGTANITGSFTFVVTVEDSDVDLLAVGVGHPALLKDTTNNEFIAKLCFTPILGDRDPPA